MSDVVPLLDKTRILASSDFKDEIVDVPEWGGPIRLRGLTGAERSWTSKVLRDVDSGKAMDISYDAALVVCAAINEQGNAIFQRADAAALARKSGAVCDRLAWKILELSGMTSASQQALEKN